MSPVTLLIASSGGKSLLRFLWNEYKQKNTAEKEEVRGGGEMGGGRKKERGSEQHVQKADKFDQILQATPPLFEWGGAFFPGSPQSRNCTNKSCLQRSRV